MDDEMRLNDLSDKGYEEVSRLMPKNNFDGFHRYVFSILVHDRKSRLTIVRGNIPPSVSQILHKGYLDHCAKDNM